MRLAWATRLMIIADFFMKRKAYKFPFKLKSDPSTTEIGIPTQKY